MASTGLYDVSNSRGSFTGPALIVLVPRPDDIGRDRPERRKPESTRSFDATIRATNESTNVSTNDTCDRCSRNLITAFDEILAWELCVRASIVRAGGMPLASPGNEELFSGRGTYAWFYTVRKVGAWTGCKTVVE